MSDLKNSIPSNAQNMDESPSYRIVDKKIIFPSIYCFLYHWTNTFDISWYSSPTKGGKPLYKLKISVKPSHWNDVLRESFPTNIQYISFAVEHHSIVRDEPSEYEPTGRHHFIVTPLHDDDYESAKEENAKHVEEEQKEFARLINKLNAQLVTISPQNINAGSILKNCVSTRSTEVNLQSSNLKIIRNVRDLLLLILYSGELWMTMIHPLRGLT